MNKKTLILMTFTLMASTNLSIHARRSSSDDSHRHSGLKGVLAGGASGALIGGLAGGKRGAGIGAGVGAITGLAIGESRKSKRRKRKQQQADNYTYTNYKK